MFENSPDAVFVEDAQGNVLDVNLAACRLHGVSREDLIGMNINELVPPELRPEIERKYAQHFEAGSGEFESFAYARDGRVVPVEIERARA